MHKDATAVVVTLGITRSLILIPPPTSKYGNCWWKSSKTNH